MPTLFSPLDGLNIILRTDASKTGLGGILIQINGETERLKSCASRSVSQIKKNIRLLI